MRILLGLTGSVATVLYEKLIKELQSVGTVDVILTNSARHFVHNKVDGCKVFTDTDEWTFPMKLSGHPCNPNTIQFHDKWEKGDKILHIDLRDKASALVIAPCSANTLAKLANGICDNLLTSVTRAWDLNRPVIIVPAMNVAMWNHPITGEHLRKLHSWGYHIVYPQSKMLACGTKGIGAMAEIDDIVKKLKEVLQWQFPLHNAWDDKNPKCSGIPVEGHQGSFLKKRKHHTHTGIDLYCKDNQPVHAVESGTVVAIEDFTGTSQQTPWWNDTKCLLVEGASGVVCYGEVYIPSWVTIGSKVIKNQFIANVKRVLKEGKERPDIEGHSTSMLHMEIYKHGIYRAFEETGDNKSDWSDLIDPTPFLINSKYAPTNLLK